MGRLGHEARTAMAVLLKQGHSQSAVSAFSAVRRGSRKLGKYEPFLSFGIARSTWPVRVCQGRSR